MSQYVIWKLKMYQIFLALIIGIGFISFISCSSTKTFALRCQESEIEIYVDDEYLGRNLVSYTPASGQEYIEISCRRDGIEVLHKRVNVKNRGGNIIEIQIPKNYRYSNKSF